MSKEKPPLYLIRRGRALYPASGLAERMIETLPLNKVLRTNKPTQPRSVKQNALYWALLTLAAENMSEPVTSDALHEWMKLRLGVTVTIRLKNGKTDTVAGSTAFENMPPEEFGPHLDRVADLICEHLIPGLGREDLLREARLMLGRIAPEAA